MKKRAFNIIYISASIWLFAYFFSMLSKISDSGYTEQSNVEKIEVMHILDENHMDYQYEQGIRYLYGKDIEKNIDQGVYFLEKSANQGNHNALMKLAWIYMYGVGVDSNHVKSIRFYTQAAEDNNIKAQYLLGDFYNEGKYVEQDFIEAFKWFKLAAENGHDQAQYRLSYAYYEGKGTDQDSTEAKKWFTKFCDYRITGAHNKSYYIKRPECYKDGRRIGLWAKRL